MTTYRCRSRIFIAAVIALAAVLTIPPPAQSQSAPATIADQESILIDAEGFKVIPGHMRPDAANRIKALSARELGPGAIIYRSGDKIYILGAPLVHERSGSGRSASLE